MSALPEPDDLIHEDEVYKRYGHLLADRELREARKTGAISFYDLRKGIHYTVPQIMEYLNQKLVKAQCPNNSPLDPNREVPEGSRKPSASSSSGRSGSPTSATVHSFTAAGMTRELEERAASLLEQPT